ncbi:cytosolic carboxypeptidase-like protein 5 isoform X1 [Planococcus citri]|uniref:cytosolic carboxypeptidase-like protein 5 isoform X1 n=1 Tax=Planococcus citri TaxID=170843 RepID=UPI0031F87F0D
MDIECGGFTFVSNFDSSNIDRVELVPSSNSGEESSENDIPLYEFNIWTRADCAGTEFENNNRSWFYFGVKGGTPYSDIKLNVVNLNKQGKLYNQGMAPVFKASNETDQWERVRDRLSFDLKRNLLSFGYRTLENLCSTTYFAFTYPFSFTDLQSSLKQYDSHIKKLNISSNVAEAHPDDIYYHRECLTKSLEDRPVDLITISSHHNITNVRETRLKGLFPDASAPRPFLFKGKKVIFLSARVHPGETPSSFVMNGIMQLLLNRTDCSAIALRRLYVFKLIPMLNPDGVSRGFYRTDTRGANLNRFYLNPSESLHPSVFAARSLILYYHHGYERKLDSPARPTDATASPCSSNASPCSGALDVTSANRSDFLEPENKSDERAESSDLRKCSSETCIHTKDTDELNDKVAEITMDENITSGITTAIGASDSNEKCSVYRAVTPPLPKLPAAASCDNTRKKLYKIRQFTKHKDCAKKPHESGLFLYIDFHGHASKKGIFMYGNHFDNISDKVECLLLPKLLSLNNPHFHFSQCNFSKRNMYTRDRRDGLSKEGCGRVAVLKYTGLVRSYTLECNYNTGCIVNIIPPTQRPLVKHLVPPQILVPPKYTPQIYEEVGRALCVSILDVSGQNPNSRLPASQYKSIDGLKESLRGEAIVARGVQSQQNLKMRQGLSLLQRGNKNAALNYTAKRKLLSLKRASKSSLFTEISSSTSVDLKENPATASKPVKINRPTKSSTTVLHPLNKCSGSGGGGGGGGGSGGSSGVSGSPSNPINTLRKRRRKAKLKKELQNKKIAFKKKLIGAYKIETETWSSKGEPSNWNANKRKIEKKSSPNGNPSTSTRLPNKMRKKTKLI